MAVAPSLSTSLVPHQQTEGKKPSFDVIGLLSYFFYVILGIVFVMAVGVFLYSRVLISIKNSKEAALTKQTQALAAQQVQAAAYARLRSRLDAAVGLVDKHTVASAVFPEIERLLPGTVQLNSIHLSFGEGSPQFSAEGVAKNYNALALASSAFSKSQHFKDALLKIEHTYVDGSVAFTFTSTVDPVLTTFSP
jgi:Tfp pilus assembly protein PilN